MVAEEVLTSSGAQVLNGADLRAVDLRHAHLDSTALIGADLSRAKLAHTDLTDADLTDADLTDANLVDSDLRKANLSDAKGLTDEQLDQVKSLEGTTMPNGQKYEDWLRTKDRVEDRHNQ